MRVRAWSSLTCSWWTTLPRSSDPSMHKTHAQILAPWPSCARRCGPCALVAIFKLGSAVPFLFWFRLPSQLDLLLVDQCAQEFRSKHGQDPHSNPRGLAKLRKAVGLCSATWCQLCSLSLSLFPSQLLLDHFAQDFRCRHGQDPGSNPHALAKLRKAVRFTSTGIAHKAGARQSPRRLSRMTVKRYLERTRQH